MNESIWIWAESDLITKLVKSIRSPENHNFRLDGLLLFISNFIIARHVITRENNVSRYHDTILKFQTSTTPQVVNRSWSPSIVCVKYRLNYNEQL